MPITTREGPLARAWQAPARQLSRQPVRSIIFTLAFEPVSRVPLELAGMLVTCYGASGSDFGGQRPLNPRYSFRLSSEEKLETKRRRENGCECTAHRVKKTVALNTDPVWPFHVVVAIRHLYDKERLHGSFKYVLHPSVCLSELPEIRPTGGSY